MPFLTKLNVEYQGDQFVYPWKLKSPLIYQSKYVGPPIVVEAGFSTDFASVPRVPFAFWFAGGCANEPAVIHDYLYYKKLVPKSVADKIFLEAMGEIDLPFWKRVPMYWAVSLFGGRAWNAK